MNSELFWDQFLFCIVTTVFLVINFFNIRNNNNSNNKISAEQETGNSTTKKPQFVFKLKPNPLLKAILNFYTIFLSPILFIGFASESYLVGSQLFGNLFSVSIGYFIAFFLVIPIIYNLDKSIKTPYEYFEKRFNSKVPRIISALSASCFYFSLSTLFLFGASIVLSTLMPQIPIWASGLIVGIYSMLAVLSKENAFKYTFLTSLIQLSVFLVSVATAIVITLFFNEQKSVTDLLEFAWANNRFRFINTDLALTTRYTLWNQLFSLPIPWVVVHCLTVANFTKYR
jgi:Na+/proline symporter